ncbi:UNKNOWN [Stylonychia lemnae]|uniref:Kinase domain protein n=1 Tax=Stylonychia lemnae TaxID=5949 RepID=A0A078ASK0_STYLE|nr:UNKNOWN [Stylonychia lemnae]|eukprot:CDW84187.1 UNKNOWN [Stylonychia lemnae]
MAQFQRPQTHRIVDLLTFIQLKEDLFKIREFATQSLGFNKVQFGNQYFKLKTGTDKTQDDQNLETLHHLLKKTKGLILNRLYKTYEVLEYLCENFEKYQNIQSMTIDFNKEFIKLIVQVTKLHELQELNLIQAFFDEDIKMFEQTSAQNLEEIEDLDIGLSSTQNELGENLELFKQFSKLKKLRISFGKTDLSIFEYLPNIEVLESNGDLLASSQLSVKYFENLKKLSIINIEKEMIFDILQELSSCLKLKELEINYPIKDDYKPLQLFFQRNKSVEVLMIKKIKVFDRFEFMIGLAENNTLKHLFFELLRTDIKSLDKDTFFAGNQNMTLETLSIKASIKAKSKYFVHSNYMAELIGMLKNLTNFEIYNFSLLGDQFSNIIDSITNTINLQSLSMQQCTFETNDLLCQLLIALTEKQVNLKVLKLNQSQLNVRTMEVGVIKFLSENKSIQRLDLQFCEIDFTAGLSLILEACGKHPVLQYLDITHSKLWYLRNDIKLKQMVECVIKNCQNLQYLFMQDSNTVRQIGIEDMLKEQVKIIYDNCPKMMELKI